MTAAAARRGPLVVLVAAFTVSRIAAWAAGVRFDTVMLAEGFQILADRLIRLGWRRVDRRPVADDRVVTIAAAAPEPAVA